MRLLEQEMDSNYKDISFGIHTCIHVMVIINFIIVYPVVLAMHTLIALNWIMTACIALGLIPGR